jgi:hypothetical protein
MRMIMAVSAVGPVRLLSRHRYSQSNAPLAETVSSHHAPRALVTWRKALSGCAGARTSNPCEFSPSAIVSAARPAMPPPGPAASGAFAVVLRTGGRVGLAGQAREHGPQAAHGAAVAGDGDVVVVVAAADIGEAVCGKAQDREAGAQDVRGRGQAEYLDRDEGFSHRSREVIELRGHDAG